MSPAIERPQIGMHYGSHYAENDIRDSLTHYGEGLLRKYDTGTLLIFFESADLLSGSTGYVNTLLNQGISPADAYQQTLHWSAEVLFKELGRSEDPGDYVMNTRFMNSQLEAYTYLSGLFPGRTEMVLEEAGVKEIIQRMQPQRLTEQQIVNLVQGGSIMASGMLLENSVTQDVARDEKRDAAISEQLLIASERPDVIGITGHLGSLHSQAIGRKMQEEGRHIHSMFLEKDESGDVFYHPINVMYRWKRFANSPIPQSAWYQAAIATTVLHQVFTRLPDAQNSASTAAWFAQHAVKNMDSMDAIERFSLRQELVGSARALELLVDQTAANLRIQFSR
jgi:hypothetical protein